MVIILMVPSIPVTTIEASAPSPLVTVTLVTSLDIEISPQEYPLALIPRPGAFFPPLAITFPLYIVIQPQEPPSPLPIPGAFSPPVAMTFASLILMCPQVKPYPPPIPEALSPPLTSRLPVPTIISVYGSEIKMPGYE